MHKNGGMSFETKHENSLLHKGSRMMKLNQIMKEINQGLFVYKVCIVECQPTMRQVYSMCLKPVVCYFKLTHANLFLQQVLSIVNMRKLPVTHNQDKISLILYNNRSNKHVKRSIQGRKVKLKIVKKRPSNVETR